MHIQFGKIRWDSYSTLGSSLGSMLKNTAQSSSKDIFNVSLLSPMMPSYSMARDRPNEDKYGDADFVAYTLKVFESV